MLTTVVWLHRDVGISDRAVTTTRSQVSRHTEPRLQLETSVIDTPFAVGAFACSLTIGDSPLVTMNVQFARTRFALHLRKNFIFFTRVWDKSRDFIPK